MPNKNILLSDTNIILKIMLFEKIDLCSISIPEYGVIKFHPIVQDEINEWLKRHQVKRVRKIEKFSLEKIQSALKKVRSCTQIVSVPTETEKELAFGQYESVLGSISSNSALPSENDLILLLHAEKMSCYMLTCDDILYKLGHKIIGEKSIELEDLFISLLKNNTITETDIREYAKLLESYGELFKLSKVLKHHQ